MLPFLPDECGVFHRILRCLNPDACIGTLHVQINSNNSNSSDFNACDTERGYSGPLCQTCAPPFYLTFSGCETCDEKLPAGERLAIVLAVLLVLVLIVRYVTNKLKKHLLYQSVLSHFVELLFVLFDLMQIVG